MKRYVTQLPLGKSNQEKSQWDCTIYQVAKIKNIDIAKHQQECETQAINNHEKKGECC